MNRHLKNCLLWDFAPLWLFSLLLAALCFFNWPYGRLLFLPGIGTGAGNYMGPVLLFISIILIALAVGSLLLSRFLEYVFRDRKSPMLWWLLIMPNIACALLFLFMAVVLVMLGPAAIEMQQQAQHGAVQDNGL